MNNTKNKLINYLLDYVEQGAEYPEIILQNIAYKTNAEVNCCGSSSYSEIYLIKKKGEILYQGHFRDVLEYLVFHILNS